jgi:hypothetical protein
MPGLLVFVILFPGIIAAAEIENAAFRERKT